MAESGVAKRRTTVFGFVNRFLSFLEKRTVFQILDSSCAFKTDQQNVTAVVSSFFRINVGVIKELIKFRCMRKFRELHKKVFQCLVDQTNSLSVDDLSNQKDEIASPKLQSETHYDIVVVCVNGL